MADEKSKPGDKPAQETAAQSNAGKYIGLLLAYKWLLIGASAFVLILAVGSYWYFYHEASPEPAALFARALECLEDRENPDAIPEARKIASNLDAIHYSDPKFVGAVPYILGILDFRRGSAQTDRDRQESFRLAVLHLEQIGAGLDADHQFEVEFALGISRYSIGDAVGAEQPLKRVLSNFRGDDIPNPRPEFFEAAAALQESYLDRRDPRHLKEAIALNDSVLKKANLTIAERDKSYLRRAEIFVALHDGKQAQESISRVSNAEAAKRGTALIQAQVDIAEKRFKDAHQRLGPLANEGGLDAQYPRQASFLLGVCYETEADYENALRKYADVVRRYPDSPEGLAANVRRAELLRKAQRWEEALESYIKALEMIRPTGFTNRWLRLDDLRVLVTAAWEDLKKTQAYEFAIELARHMRSLFPPNEAYQALERVATANQLWAAQLEEEAANQPFRLREEKTMLLLERWRTSGKAYADLAEALHESPKYSDVLWISSEHYRRGHDFPNALVQMTRFINTQPRQRLPLAFVRRGEILMDLGRFEEALDHFERVLAEFPNDIAAFEAMYLVGACNVELDRPDKAVAAWQRVLHEGHLDPSANEWQTSLFALGRLQFQYATTLRAEQNSNPIGTSSEARRRPLEAFARLDDAIRRLEEFAARYPKRPEAPEARFLLAKALRNRSALPRHKLERAETDNARKELQNEIQRLLTEAQNQLESLIEMLQSKEVAGMLDPLGVRMLRDSYFERAHNLYAMGKFERAVEAYTNAANRYAEDPNVFLAYIQMANCFDRLGKPIDARGAAIQAMLIHKNMPEKAFTLDKTLMNRDEWRTWLEWASALHQGPRLDNRNSPPASTVASPPVAFPKSS